jgi:serine/threonine-protein kinase
MVLRGTDDEGQPRDVVKVCDFGIAKFVEDRGAPNTGDEKLTKAGIIMGTPEYMSPEQCRGERLDVRSDLYSMGVILYQLLTRRLPFEEETPLATVLKQLNDAAPPPRTINPDADERLEAVCLKAMRKVREQRYQTAREMRADLRDVVGAWAPEAVSQTSLEDLPSQPTQSVADGPRVPSNKATKRWLGRQPPADEEAAWEGSATPTVDGDDAGEASLPASPREVGSTQRMPAREPREPQATQRMPAREPREPQATQRMKPREGTGPTGTAIMKAREGRGPRGTVLMKARGGGPASGRSRAWLIIAAVVGALALVLTAWALARR